MNMISLINDLKKEDIDSFIDNRLSVLGNKEELELGFKTNITRYDGFLDDKTRVNVTCDFILVDGIMETYTGSILFDDKEMYKYLIKSVKENNCIYDAVNDSVKKYLSLDTRCNKYRPIEQYQKIRANVYHQYSTSMNKPLSIKLFHENKAALCAEVAGVTQNMLRFLDVESDYVILGEEDHNFHAFNIVYPNGRDNKALIYDFSNISDGRPLICILEDNQKEDLLSNKSIFVTEKQIAETFGKDIKWKEKETEYFIFEDGDPKKIAEYKKPFDVIKKLKFKREVK